MKAIFWFRRDLRLEDNRGLFEALTRHDSVMPVFIFDPSILNHLDRDDARVTFIWDQLKELDQRLIARGSGLKVGLGDPVEVMAKWVQGAGITDVFANRDDEPDTMQRDETCRLALEHMGAQLHLFKDKAIFERGDIVTSDGSDFRVFTPYQRAWCAALPHQLELFPSESMLHRLDPSPPEWEVKDLSDLGFSRSAISVSPAKVDPDQIARYAQDRDSPGIKGTTQLGIHLRFGTVSTRKLVSLARDISDVFLAELIWREFFQQHLYHHPTITHLEFKERFRQFPWQHDEEAFVRWCDGTTGFPLVDAGMRQLNQTGFMHNRVRMVVASFLTKDLIIDWRWGERYFARKLLDFELASNCGNWQWVAGCGCDAAPYFRIFNPELQAVKFDPDQTYIKQWVPELGTKRYPMPMVDHAWARKRALACYRNLT
ncbi:MAG: deoxyribodipyrimidine photo-lyase [Acidobacteria bacterium]|nr:deoxyribodipyrimidine photo-lyase [Acidobacteriota bacterium]